MPNEPLRFSHYRVLTRADGSPWTLGVGAMGVTYKAFDERLELAVALKVIAPGRIHDRTVQALFLREARAAARVRHTNVASVLALDDTPGNFYYAMEFVPGITLHALMKERRRLGPGLALRLAAQTAHGLEAIHRQGIVHRDLKPANLMLVRRGESADAVQTSESWQVKVIDFGLARTFRGDESHDETAAQTIGFRGTSLYASPEQCLERSDLDGRTDLYALGCILWEMVLGRSPFPARSHHELMHHHISRRPPLEQLDHLPGVRALIGELLAKNPTDRPATAAVTARRLEQLAAEFPQHANDSGDGTGRADEENGGRASSLPPVDPEARALYLEGRNAAREGTADSLQRAQECYERALARAPKFAEVHVGLARIALARGDLSGALAAGQAAVALDPKLAGAHAVLGDAYRTQGEAGVAVEHFRRAIALRAGHASTHQALARSLAADGRIDEALKEIDLAVTHDPDSRLIMGNRALLLLLARRPQDALSQALHGLTDAAGETTLLGWKTWALAELELHDEAVPAARALLRTPGGRGHFTAIRALLAAGLRPEAEEILRTITHHSGLVRCRACALLGRNGEALALLDPRSLPPATHDLLLFDPMWDPFRTEERFQATLAELRLTAAHGRAQAWRARPPEMRHAPSDATEETVVATQPALAEESRPPTESISPTVVTPPSSVSPRESTSIAVMPFANLSGDKEQEYFSDGIAEELMNALAKVPGLRIAARTSAFFFKGRSVPIAEIARQLAVTYVVEGSVRRAGDRARISVQLISAADGFQVWADSFQRELRDVFAVQDEIAGIVAGNLKLKLDPATAAAGRIDGEALRLYLLGREASRDRSLPRLLQAEEHYRSALEIEPRFPRALGGLADVLTIRAVFAYLDAGSSAEADALAQAAEGYARQAIAIDPRDGEAISGIAFAAQTRGETEESIRLFRQALDLNPSNAITHQRLGRGLAFAGHLDDALAHAARAGVLDPLSQRIADNHGMLLLLAGRPAEALTALDRARAISPADPQVLALRARALLALGRNADALQDARAVMEQNREWLRWIALLVFSATGETAEAAATLALARQGHPMPHAFALAAAGRAGEALDVLPTVYGAVYHETFIFDPIWDPVRDDPRFIAYLAKLGLTEAHARARAWRNRGGF